MQINQYANQATDVNIQSFFDLDQWISPGVFQSQKIDLPTIVGGIESAFPNLFDNIYKADGALDSDRTVDHDGYDLYFVNGKFAIGTTNPITPFRLHVVGNDASGDFANALIAQSNVGSAIQAGSVSGNTIISFSSSGRGVTSFSPSNLVRKNSTGIIPTIDPSSIWDVFSDDQGVRAFPGNPDPKINISSPADGLISQNTTIGYPEIYHPIYEWQPIAYGEIRLTIDFSVTPLIGGAPIYIPTAIPEGKIIHKIVAMGESIDTSFGATILYMGHSSDTTHFGSLISNLNSLSGDSINSNSERTPSSGLDFVIGSDDEVSSGVLELLILHT